VIHELRLFFIALQFLTRLPAPRWVGFEPEWLNQSARHFPAVGVLVGAVAVLVLVLGEVLFPPAVAVGLSMAATLLLTGAFHEDGWADTCDALGGGASIGRERALLIMKDSRIGTYGAVGLLLMLGLKAATVLALPLALAVPAFLFAHTASRAAAVALMRWLPYVGAIEHAKAKPLAQRISGAGLVVALGWLLLLCFALVWAAQRWGEPSVLPAVLLGLLVVAAAASWCARWFRQRLGGYTGDTLGATQQLTELLALLAWLGVAGV
jgi:adenosylcobinamide-GDP ribazoletransferase